MSQHSTQSRYPWRTVVRTVFQLTLALASLLPVIAMAGDVAAVPAVAQVLAVCAAITRIMARPEVDAFLRRFAPWLAAEPRQLD